MKKLLSVLALGLLIASCGEKKEETKTDSGSEKKKLKVAVVFSGFLGDKSFNDSAYEGLKKAEADSE